MWSHIYSLAQDLIVDHKYVWIDNKHVWKLFLFFVTDKINFRCLSNNFLIYQNKHILGRLKIVSVNIGHFQYILACWSETWVAYLALIQGKNVHWKVLNLLISHCTRLVIWKLIPPNTHVVILRNRWKVNRIHFSSSSNVYLFKHSQMRKY